MKNCINLASLCKLRDILYSSDFSVYGCSKVDVKAFQSLHSLLFKTIVKHFLLTFGSVSSFSTIRNEKSPFPIS